MCGHEFAKGLASDRITGFQQELFCTGAWQEPDFVAVHRFVEKGLRFIRLRAPPKFYGFVAQLVGRPELSRGQLERLQRLGAKVGLGRDEVHTALAAQAEPRKRQLQGRLLVLVVTLAALATILFAAWALGYFRYPTYIPGTLYSALNPHDFE
jgi:hypothetical protein